VVTSNNDFWFLEFSFEAMLYLISRSRNFDYNKLNLSISCARSSRRVLLAKTSFLIV